MNMLTYKKMMIGLSFLGMSGAAACLETEIYSKVDFGFNGCKTEWGR
jgi:hypothetical protein